MPMKFPDKTAIVSLRAKLGGSLLGVLAYREIKTVGEFRQATAEDMVTWPNFGQGLFDRAQAWFAAQGVAWPSDRPTLKAVRTHCHACGQPLPKQTENP